MCPRSSKSIGTRYSVPCAPSIRRTRLSLLVRITSLIRRLRDANILAAISRSLIEQLGVSEVQSQILTEMELAEFTIQIHCRQCVYPSPVLFLSRERNDALPTGADALPLWIVKTTRRCSISCALRVTATTCGAKSASRRSSPTVRNIHAMGRLSWTT